MATRKPGFRRLPGPGRRYVSPAGEEISYRAYRDILERERLVQRLGAVELANARLRRREFQQIVNQMAKVQAEALDRAIAEGERAGLPRPELDLLKKQRRTVRQTAIRSPERKSAIDVLRETNKQRTMSGGRRTYRSSEAEERTKRALIALGRREGIPDWVPVGYSDQFKRGSFRRSNVPRRFRAGRIEGKQ